ncbi:hypothetical protein RB195_018345 [Necator americanus]|uniref:GYF domain-containing protein n=1 Tax=Necator americanus TaxID=51031 RepID=A0ABR1CC83_NECAM
MYDVATNVKNLTELLLQAHENKKGRCLKIIYATVLLSLVVMTSSVPVAAADNVQQSTFNPSWMRSAFNGAGGGAPVRSPKTDYPVAAPVFVKNRYGREDMLALMGDAAGHPAPEGLRNCPFYVEEALPPIVCYPLSDLEQRLQHNINSSKAMSSLSHAERASVATGAALGGGNADGTSIPHKTNSSAWTPVKPWNRNHPVGSASAKGAGASRSHVTSARNGPRGDGTCSNQDQPQLTAFGQRFANRGRGAPASARGGGVSGTAFNSRAQGLYDPRDPKDRPRNRMRSTSDEGDTLGDGGWTTAGGGKHAWGNHTKDSGEHTAWASGQGGNGSSTDGVTHEGTRKSESGPLPEWMDDGEDQEKTESSDDTTSATGSFDEHGRFRKKQHSSADSKSLRKTFNPAQSKQQQNATGTTALTSTERSDENAAPPQAPCEANSSSTQVDALKTESVSSRSFTNLRQQSDSAGYGGCVTPQILSTVTQVASSVPTPVIHQGPPQFYYLDPMKQERGPFEKIQMDSWYKRGYFTDGLEVRRHTDTKYKTLGELMQLNGRVTPFDYKDDVVSSPPVTAVFSNPTQPFATLFTSGGMWGELGSPANMIYGQPGYDPIAVERKRIEEEQRRILEEQVKMREYQERIMREMQKQREEHEKQLMEQKMALLKHQEEIERRERELKESAEETKARLEMERLALAEKARQIEEERTAKIKQELEDARKEEEKRIEEEQRRQKEELERLRKEEEEELRKREQAERERRAQQAAEEEACRLRAAAELAAEKIRLQQAEQQRKQRAVEEQRKKAAAGPAQEKEKRQDNAKAFEIEETWQAASKPVQSGVDSVTATKKSPSTKAAPWLAAVAAPPKEKSLKEIQEEEERQLRAEQAEQARLRKEQEIVSIQSSGTWSNASQRLQWNQPPQTIVTKAPATKPAWGGAGVEPLKATSSPYWDGPSLQAANKVHNAPSNKLASEKSPSTKSSSVKAGSNALVNEKAAKRALGMTEDSSIFLDWVVQRLKQLNSTVEADVLAMFIEGVENPDEVEDYVVGYLGDSKAVKEFVREFLQKRSDFRNRKLHAVKDDLSSARGAPISGNTSGGFSAVQGRKKKNKGARLVVDGSCLGFRATSDPNRVNQGEIETVALSPEMFNLGRRVLCCILLTFMMTAVPSYISIYFYILDFFLTLVALRTRSISEGSTLSARSIDGSNPTESSGVDKLVADLSEKIKALT